MRAAVASGSKAISLSKAITLLAATSLALLALAIGVPPAAGQGGDTFIVRSTGDGGDVNLGDDVCDAHPLESRVRCTLRAAIQEANADTDEDRIEFRIGGANATGVKVIEVPDLDLPTITRPLVIDGYTQPGSSRNTAGRGTNAVLRIVLDGPGPFTAVGLEADDVPIDVRGLVIGDFGVGIRISGDDSIIAGNFIGTDAAGSAPRPTGWGIEVYGADRSRIGGSRRADRNLIGGNGTSGVYIGFGDGLRIMGNLIGVTASGAGDLGPDDYGIEFSADSAHDVLIGGDTKAKANVIAHAGSVGVSINDTGGGTGLSVRVLRNEIYANADLAIDLDIDGVTPNDGAPDADAGDNGLQNYPEIDSAISSGGVTTIRGTLLTAPARSYRLEFFSNPGATRQARKYIGGTIVTTDGTGFARWRFVPARMVPEGRAVLATATDLTAKQTSELSAPRTVTSP